MMNDQPDDALPRGSENPAPDTGAVSDSIPPTQRQFDPSKAISQSRQRESSKPNISPAQKLPGQAVTLLQQQRTKKTEVMTPAGMRNPNQAALVASPGMADAFVIDDLSHEQLLRNTQRVLFRGQMCPSLNGIPLIAKLGQGGMGAVYCGIHPRLQNRVAVKVLPLHLAAADAGLVQRLVREAQIAAMIQSPHLAAVYDVNEEDGQFFIVMEYVSGLTVGQHVKSLALQGQHGMREIDALNVCIAACIGLDAAHQESVIHRDLKPENIMIPYRSRQHDQLDLKRAKLMDLGLARSEKSSSPKDQSLTGIKVAMGTPGYMSPEQIMNAKTASKPSDVYGMGATLYAMLTGRPPYKGEDGEDVMRMIFATVNDPLIPASRLRRDLSEDVDRLVSKCLEKKPEKRYADAQELTRALVAARRALASTGSFEEYDANSVKPRRTPGIGITDSVLAPDTDRPRNGNRKRWIWFGAGAAGVAVLVGALIVNAVYPRGYSKEQRNSIIEVHGDTIRKVYEHIRTNPAQAEEFFNSAREQTGKHPGIPELVQSDATASAFIAARAELARLDLKLDDLRALESRIATMAVVTQEEIAEKTALLDAIKTKINEARLKKATQEVRRNDISSADRLRALRTWIELEPTNADAKAMLPSVEAAGRDALARDYFLNAKKLVKSERFDMALREVKESVAVLKTDAAIKLQNQIEGKLSRMQQQARFNETLTAFEKAYNDTLTAIAAAKFTDAMASKAVADSLYQKVRAIDPSFDPGAQWATLQERIEANARNAAYHTALDAARVALNAGDAIFASRKLDDAKRIQPPGESGAEAAELAERLGRVNYTKAMETARALKAGPNFDGALQALESASMNKPTDESGAELVALKRDTFRLKNRAAFSVAFQAAQEFKAGGKWMDALAKIDDARERAAAAGGDVDRSALDTLDALEREIIAAKRAERIVAVRAENAAREKAKFDAEFARQLQAAKQRVGAAMATGERLLTEQKYDDAIMAYESVRADAATYKMSESASLENAIALAQKAKIENSPEAKLKRRLDEAMSVTATVPDTELGSKLALLETTYRDVDDPALKLRKLDLQARQTRLIEKSIEEKLASANKAAFEQALAAFKVEKYDDAVAVLNTARLTSAAVVLGEVKTIIEGAREEAATYQKAYTSPGGSKEKIAGPMPEIDKAFTSALAGLTTLHTRAHDQLASLGLNGTTAAADKIRMENAEASKTLAGAWKAVMTAFVKVQADEAAALAASKRANSSGGVNTLSSGFNGGKVRTGETESGR